MAIKRNVGFLGKGIARFGRKSCIWGVAGVAGLFLAACASVGGLTEESPVEVKQAAVTERAKARWQAVIEGDVEKSYSFLSPGSKTTNSLDRYKARARLTGFRSAEITSVACEAETCRVKVQTTLDHRLMKGLQVPIEETWVLADGQYWYVWLL